MAVNKLFGVKLRKLFKKCKKSKMNKDFTLDNLEIFDVKILNNLFENN